MGSSTIIVGSVIKQLDGIMLSSEDSTRLGEFYKDVVGLEEGFVFDGPEGNGYEFPEVGLYISPHSEVKGKNSTPERHILNFEVENIDEEAEKLTSRGAKQIKEVYEVEGYGLVTTFEDPDGNYFQLVEINTSN